MHSWPMCSPKFCSWRMTSGVQLGGGLEAAVPGHNTGTVAQSLERAMACLSTFSPLTVACAVHTSPDVLDPKFRAGRQVRSGRVT